MRKRIITGLTILLTAGMASALTAQSCELYTDVKEGSSLKMTHYDKKDKVTGYTTTTITKKEKIPEGVRVGVHQVYNDTEEDLFDSKLEMECRDGVIYFDMKDFLDPSSMSAYEEMEMEITADEMTIPSNAKPGTDLNDGTIEVSINTGSPVTVNMTVTTENRKVEANEKITTPAGTFDCLKITYDMVSKIGFVKVQSSAIEWYSPGTGTIRTESYNKRGKLTGYTVLEEIN